MIRKPAKKFLDAIAECRDRLTSEGVDLSAFDLREMAADAQGSANRAWGRPVGRDDVRDGVPESHSIPTWSIRPTCALQFSTAPSGRG